MKCEIHSFATITDGTFNGAVYNLTETISGGIFNGTVTRRHPPEKSLVAPSRAVWINQRHHQLATAPLKVEVTNDSNGDNLWRHLSENSGKQRQRNNHLNGTFNGTSDKQLHSGTASHGTCNASAKAVMEQQINDTIFGGIFAGSVNNSEGCNIYGGVFNGKTGLDGVTVLISITVASGAKITEVNGVSADWDPYVVVTSLTENQGSDHHRRHRDLQPERLPHRREPLLQQLPRYNRQEDREIHRAGRAGL